MKHPVHALVKEEREDLGDPHDQECASIQHAFDEHLFLVSPARRRHRPVKYETKEKSIDARGFVLYCFGGWVRNYIF